MVFLVSGQAHNDYLGKYIFFYSSSFLSGHCRHFLHLPIGLSLYLVRIELLLLHIQCNLHYLLHETLQ